MPKLDSKTAKAVAEQESTTFEALPEGVYTVQLKEVEVRDTKAGDSQYWVWKLEVQDEGYAGRLLWLNTSLKETAQWKLKEVFDAFGYTTDSDTDEMIGDRIKVAVSQRLIEQGSRKGSMGNNIDRCLPADADGDEDDESF